MAARPGRSALRRGLIVALDGLAVWLLAVVLAAYTDAGSVAGSGTGSGLLATAVDTTSRWAATPGVGGFELLVYVGMAATVLGPLWYGIGRPVAGRLGLVRSIGDPDRRREGFQYDHSSSATRDGANPVVRHRRSTGAAGTDTLTGGSPDGLQWVSDLFDPEHAPGEFLRGGSGRDADGSELPPAGSEAPSDGIDTGDDGTTTEDKSAVEAAEPAASVDVVASAVATSRTRIDALSGRLRAASDGSDVEAAGAELASITEAAEETLRPLRTIDQDGAGPAHRRIQAVRAEQRRIESALAAVPNGR